jgi:hypothetical protein
MKPLVIIGGVFVLGLIAVAFSQDAGDDKNKAIMQAKLEHSQALLAGLATEDFKGLARHSSALTVLSLETDWNVLQTAEYRRLSNEFRRGTKKLKEAADEKNLDGATLAYVGLTMKCVECHKYVRSVGVGRTP